MFVNGKKGYVTNLSSGARLVALGEIFCTRCADLVSFMASAGTSKLLCGQNSMKLIMNLTSLRRHLCVKFWVKLVEIHPSSHLFLMTPCGKTRGWVGEFQATVKVIKEHEIYSNDRWE